LMFWHIDIVFIVLSRKCQIRFVNKTITEITSSYLRTYFNAYTALSDVKRRK